VPVGEDSAAVPVADPARRNRDLTLIEGEISSPIRDIGDDPLVEPLFEVGTGHFVAATGSAIFLRLMKTRISPDVFCSAVRMAATMSSCAS